MNIREQLKRDEGTVNHAYEDSLGFLTIGVGRLIDVRRGGGLSSEEVDLLLTNDIAEKTKAVLEALPWAASLNEPRLAVLINMAFQLGLHGLLQFKNTLAEVQKGHYGIAAAMMLDSKWENQTPTRAHRLADQMESGEWV